MNRDKQVEASMFSPSVATGKPTLIKLVVAGIASVLIALLITPTGVASAASYSSKLTQHDVNLRPCVYAMGGVCSPVGTTTNAGAATMICFRDGVKTTGRYTSNRWFLIEASSHGGPQGFVHSSYVTNQTKVPNCNTMARVRAVDWALTQVSKTHAADEYSNMQNKWGMYWGPGPDLEWAGDCAKLPFIAYKRQGVPYPLDDANKQWERMPDRRVSPAYYPRFGDPVFWTIPGVSEGHTALYIGGTQVVGTQGLDDDGKPVAIYNLQRSGWTYLGYGRVA